MRLVTNAKTAAVLSSLAVLAMAVAWAVSGFSIAFPTLPATFLVMAETVGLIPKTLAVPRIIWKLLFWPLEFVMYAVPMLLAGWGGMVLMLLFMVIMNCTNELRYILYDTL